MDPRRVEWYFESKTSTTTLLWLFDMVERRGKKFELTERGKEFVRRGIKRVWFNDVNPLKLVSLMLYKELPLLCKVTVNGEEVDVCGMSL